VVVANLAPVYPYKLYGAKGITTVAGLKGKKVGTYNPMVDKGHAERLVIKEERVKHWLGVGALPTDRVAKFFGDVGLGAKPAIRETPSKSAPKAKAQERAKAADEAAKAAAPEA